MVSASSMVSGAGLRAGHTQPAAGREPGGPRAAGTASPVGAQPACALTACCCTCAGRGLCELSCRLPVLLAAQVAAAAQGTLLGALGCRLLTFLAGLFCFQVPFLLLGVGVFSYTDGLASWRCATMLVCVSWALALAGAFLPLLENSADKEHVPCALEQRTHGTSDARLPAVIQHDAGCHTPSLPPPAFLHP